jgi:RNA polymerase sigma-70 factor (ECF subfamily)
MMGTDNTRLNRPRFEDVVRPHFDALYRAAMRLTRSREDAEDLVQEVALRACCELERIAALDSPRAWLLRVQYRVFVDELRRRTRSPIASGSDAADTDSAASDDPGPEELTETAQRSRQLARAWPALDRRQRALLALHAEGYSLAELATITGLTRNAVGVSLHRARARLAKLIRNDSTGGLQLVQAEA